MSVSIRLARVGKRNAPAFKVVVSNTRDKRNGKFLDILGYFDPSVKAEGFSINMERYKKWVENGAITTSSVVKLMEGKYEHAKYRPKAAETDKEAKQKPVPEN